MFKILVVDDQTLIRKGILKMIDWDGLGAVPAGEADNGLSAIEAVKRDRPDVVVTDMRMPVFDGVTLLKDLQDNYPEIKTIVISGYDDFGYASQAIRSGSVNYILKPVNPVELNESIRKAFGLIKRERAFLSLDRDKLLNECLHNLLHGIEQDRGMLARCMEGADTKGVVCAAVVKRADPRMDAANICDQLNACGRFQKVFLLQDGSEWVFTFLGKDGQRAELYEGIICGCLKDMLMKKAAGDTKVIAGVGKVGKGVEQLKDSYKTACDLMPYSLFEDKSTILLYTDIMNRKQYNIPVEEYESELILSITSGNVNQVENVLDHLTQGVFERRDISVDSVRLLISNLCHILLKTDTGLADEIQEFLKKLNSHDYFLSFDSIRNVKQALYNLYRFTTRKYLNGKGGKEALVSKVREFIDRNYANDIGLDGISKLFHVNASYLSSLFKKETGENLNEYITKVRISNAIRIMETCDAKAPALARMVGYSDYMYFYKVFKKVTGLTPKEYQNKKITVQ